MRRTFHPVGQGAFYCEQHHIDDSTSINVVYDCGSLPVNANLEEIIEDAFPDEDTIHAVFLSHLDADHVNGLPYLLKTYRVQKIYFPLLTESEKKYILTDQLIKKADSFTVSLLKDIGRYDALHDRSGEWVYIPFHFKQTHHIHKLTENLEKQLGYQVDPNALEKLWCAGNKEICKKIKAAYGALPGGLNANSMVLYSGPDQADVYAMRQNIAESSGHCMSYTKYGTAFKTSRSYVDMEDSRCSRFLDACQYKKPGCLYTGDYNASDWDAWDSLYHAFRSYWPMIGCVQIPHHGSQHNFNEEFLDMDCIFVICAGKKNRFQHPHTSVLQCFARRYVIPIIVTEESPEIVLEVR